MNPESPIPLKAYSLNHNMKPLMIQGIFLNYGVFGKINRKSPLETTLNPQTLTLITYNHEPELQG